MCHLCAINCFDTSSSYSFVRISFSWNLGTSFKGGKTKRVNMWSV